MTVNPSPQSKAGKFNWMTTTLRRMLVRTKCSWWASLKGRVKCTTESIMWAGYSTLRVCYLRVTQATGITTTILFGLTKGISTRTWATSHTSMRKPAESGRWTRFTAERTLVSLGVKSGSIRIQTRRKCARSWSTPWTNQQLETIKCWARKDRLSWTPTTL